MELQHLGNRNYSAGRRWDPRQLRKGLEIIRPVVFFFSCFFSPQHQIKRDGQVGRERLLAGRPKGATLEGSLCLDQNMALARLTSPGTMSRKEAHGAVWFP